jgi:hypothetical protein
MVVPLVIDARPDQNPIAGLGSIDGGLDGLELALDAVIGADSQDVAAGRAAATSPAVGVPLATQVAGRRVAAGGRGPGRHQGQRQRDGEGDAEADEQTARPPLCDHRLRSLL